MTLTKGDAARALSDIDAARGRVFEARSYASASPFVIIAGLMWMLADFTVQFAPARVAEYAWPVALSFGAIASIAANVTSPKSSDRAQRLRIFGVWGVVSAFLVSLFLIVPALGPIQIHSIFGVFFGFAYMGVGLWLGWRLVALGAALAALTLLGFYELRTWYALYMGLVGGGALILGGLWLRKI